MMTKYAFATAQLIIAYLEKRLYKVFDSAVLRNKKEAANLPHSYHV
ncbi:MAG: hypothetical protein ACOX3Q_10490 [Clostridia bacterium]|jgi:hypothetical protein